MTNRLRHIAAFFLIFTALFSLGWGDSEEEIRAAAENVKTVAADFVQEKQMKMLARPLVSSGRFVYAAPGSLRWQYDEPMKSLLLTHEGKTARYAFEQGRWIEQEGFDFQAMEVITEQIAGWLGGRFVESALFSARLAPGRRIVLVPKQDGFSRFIERIELQLADTPGVLTSVVLIEGEETYTRIRFSNVQINRPVDPARFKAPM